MTTSTSTSPKTSEERLAVILSNQYKLRMHRNRPKWYSGNPPETAPKCFAPWRRNDIPLISDWETCHRVVAKKAAWVGKAFEAKYYEINGVIWSWQDPASRFLVDLFTSEMETVDFALSSDPFWAPHIVVTHSPGDEPDYLDTHDNPDKLTNAPQGIVPNPWGCTPRQSFTSPAGKDQLLLPPRMSACHERDDYAQLCSMTTIKRHGAIVRMSIDFHNGLNRIRARRALFRAVGQTPDGDELSKRGREANHIDISNSHIATSDAKAEAEESDFVPMCSEIQASGFSDEDAAKSLLERCGIMFQIQLEEIGDLADSAILSGSEDEESDDDDASLPPPHSPTIASDTYKALRKLGMIYCEEDEEDEDGEEDEEEGEEDEEEGEEADRDGEEGEEGAKDEDVVEGEYEDEGRDQNEVGDGATAQGPDIPDITATIPKLTSSQRDLTSGPWEADSTACFASDGFLNLASSLKDTDEEHSSVSSVLVDEDRDSIVSGCETPYTEYEC